MLTRNQFISAIVDGIACDEYMPIYRRKRLPTTVPIYGWAPRLLHYFWPKPANGFAANMKQVAELAAEGTQIANTLESRKWSDDAALSWAGKVFQWGRVRQPDATADQVRRVLLAATRRIDNGAPMNSGWTKVAAFATSHLEDTDGAQVIWDSRVSHSLVTRLDAILREGQYTSVPSFLSGLGEVPGRGGSRTKKSRALKWPSAYRRWDSQFAASDFVKEIRNELNLRGIKAPRSDGTDDRWSIRTVEMVLFMDGY